MRRMVATKALKANQVLPEKFQWQQMELQLGSRVSASETHDWPVVDLQVAGDGRA